MVTLDALHTQRDSADHLVTDEHADYLVTIKANQPRLLAAAERALSGPADRFDDHTTHDRGHGCTEPAKGSGAGRREIPARTTARFSRFLLGQILIVTGWRRHLHPGTTETTWSTAP